MLKKITDNRHLNLLSGLVLLISSGYETWATLEEFSMGAHHGVLVFSVIQILKALPEFLDGARTLEEAESVA